MRLRWQEVEPELAGRAWRLRSLPAAPPSHSATLEPGWSLFSLAIAGLLVALYLTLFLHLASATGTMLLAFCPMALCGVVLAPHWQAIGPRGPVAPELLRRALDHGPTTRAERLYGETVLLLGDAPLARKEGRALLRQVAALVAEDRRLAAHCERLRATADPAALLNAQSERLDLEARRQSESDPIARASLTESIALCTQRLESLDALPVALSRLEAHRELVYQALELSRAALLRARAAGALAPPEIGGLRQSVGQILAEARAAEATAVELDALRRP